ncbi:MAG: hypothetical protein R3Y40_02030 [Eubacteriales bacterium]
MDCKTPYYMAYPLPEIWDEEKMCKRDREYMKGIYPEIAKLLMPYVERECDRLEYQGSLIYDEYPDKLLLRLMCSRVCEMAEKDLQTKEMYFDYNEKPWVREIIEILVYHELCQRRENWRCNRRRWY